jgi:uncharacterized membrane protein
MTTDYNRIAGHSIDRLAALSDGVLAVAMTPLVALAPRLSMYMMSLLTLGVFWVGQQTQLNHLHRSNRCLTWIHQCFLFVVTVTPFSTALLAEYTHYRLALLVYWLNIASLGWTLYWSWVCALGSGLVKADIPEHVQCHQAADRDRTVAVRVGGFTVRVSIRIGASG